MKRDAHDKVRGYRENRMERIMHSVEACPEQGKEVTAMDDVEVDVCRVSIDSISNLKERMGER